jgi:16S rRNA (cytosine1402-N4)-methyltransferase
VSAVFQHESVLTHEVIESLRPRSGGVYADATLGGAGHTVAILDASAPAGRVVAIDRDPRAIEHAHTRLAAYGDRVRVLHGPFSELPRLLRDAGYERVDGVIADLGVSSPQLDEAERGFSFMHEGPLDMRMDTTQGETARELIERVSENELADILFLYGEERRSRAIARSIGRACSEGQLATTEDLRRAVQRAVGRPPGTKVDPATRTFQALRIAVNAELEELRALIACLPDILHDDGVAVLISFHSLEDRLVKHALRDDARFQPLTKKPIIAGDDEQARNRRSRSAKLRAARRLPRALDTAQVQA